MTLELQEQKPSLKWPKPVTKTLEGGQSWSLWILEGIRGTLPEWKETFCLKVNEPLHRISMAGKNRLLNKVRWQLKKQWRKAVGEETKGMNLLQEEFQSRMTTRKRGKNHLRKRRRSQEDHDPPMTPSNMWRFCSEEKCHMPFWKNFWKKDTSPFRWSELKQTESCISARSNQSSIVVGPMVNGKKVWVHPKKVPFNKVDILMN